MAALLARLRLVGQQLGHLRIYVTCKFTDDLIGQQDVHMALLDRIALAISGLHVSFGQPLEETTINRGLLCSILCRFCSKGTKHTSPHSTM